MRRRRAAGIRCVCVQCSGEFFSNTCNAKYCTNCTNNRSGVCKECGTGFVFHCRVGAIPKMCRTCAASRQKQRKRESLQRCPREKRTTSPRVEQCKRCRVQFSCKARGPAPQLCPSCRSEAGSLCVHRVECKQCKRVTWKRNPSEFCSRACHADNERSRAYTHPCKQCGKPFQCTPSAVRAGRSYCSDDCREVAWNQKKTRTCLACGEKFAPKYKTAGKYCSRECSFKQKHLQKAEKSRAKAISRLVQRIQKAYRRRKVAAQREADMAVANAKQRACLNCGKMFRNGRDLLCSNECRDASRRRNKKSGRKSRPAHGHADRCKARGLPFDSSVTRPFVFSRDGGVCMLCGAKTVPGDRSLAPTIGHIVPLKNPLNTKHGHTAENTCTNCARCNGRQGNAVMIDGHQHHDDPRASLLEMIESDGYPLRWGPVGTENPTSLRQ